MNRPKSSNAIFVGKTTHRRFRVEAVRRGLTNDEYLNWLMKK